MTQFSPEIFEAATVLASKFVRFVNESVTPFHAVSGIASRLQEAGFSRLDDRSTWSISPGSKYFVTRNDSSIIMFVVGKCFAPGKGIKVVGAHTDSPNLQLKPAAASSVKKNGTVGTRVQTYGGGLWHTWFDRDLTLAGRLIIGDNPSKPLSLRRIFFHIPRPLLYIPSLAIHLRSAAERESFAPNAQTHVAPIFAMEDALKTRYGDPASIMTIVARDVGVAEQHIVDFDVSLVDTQPAVIGGACGEFIFASRIDNLLSCFAAEEALMNSIDAAVLDEAITLVAMFDHEEVGSASYQGAEGSFVVDVVERLCGASKHETLARSFILSVDGAHAVHPNYSDKHDDAHAPVMHRGPVVKYNANARYATDAYSSAVVQRLAQLVDVPVQKFAVKNDSPCGSTIGPILTTLAGIRGVDIGNPMWSMHSIRETAGVVDLLYLTKLIESFIKNYSSVTVE